MQTRTSVSIETAAEGQLWCGPPSSYLLFHDGLLVGVKKIPLLSQRVVLQPRSGRGFQRRQRGTFLWGLLFFPLWTVVPLGLSLHSTCGVQGSGGRRRRHRGVGLLFRFPVKPRLLQQGARQVGRILETRPPFLLLGKKGDKQTEQSTLICQTLRNGRKRRRHTFPVFPAWLHLGHSQQFGSSSLMTPLESLT